MKKLLLLALAIGVGLSLRHELPQIKRYVKIARM